MLSVLLLLAIVAVGVVEVVSLVLGLEFDDENGEDWEDEDDLEGGYVGGWGLDECGERELEKGSGYLV
jgi:hypothetical protein